jgi:hypothetical protein
VLKELVERVAPERDQDRPSQVEHHAVKGCILSYECKDVRAGPLPVLVVRANIVGILAKEGA